MELSHNIATVSRLRPLILTDSFFCLNRNAKLVLSAHFYGELTRTEEGCELLRKKKHFSEYARYIREHCAESKDSAIIAELKSVLWAVVSTCP